MCVECRKIIQLSAGTDTLCPDCAIPVFDNSEPQWKLRLKAPFHPISVQLREILTRSGMDELLDA